MSRLARRSDDHCWQEVLDRDVTPQRLAHLVGCRHCADMIRGVLANVEAIGDRLPPIRGELDERVLAALEAEAARDEATRALP